MTTNRRVGVPVIISLLAGLLMTGTPALALTATQAEDGSIGIRLLEAPVSRQSDPRAQSYIVDHLAPGTTIARSFAITNSTAEPQDIRVYAGPADISDGAFVGADAGARSELTEWTSVSARQVRLVPGETSNLEASISVPPDASEGERYGVLWAAVSSKGSSQVQVVNRVGIRIYLSVGPGGEPASDFEITSLTPGRTDDGAPYVDATVENTGGRAIDLRGNLLLRDGPGGLSAGPFKVSTGTLAPGDTESLPIELDKSLPAGPWKARLVLKSGLLEDRASATITFPERGAGATVPATDDPTWWESWPLWLGLALLVLLLALHFWLLRRRRDEADERVPEPEVVATS